MRALKRGAKGRWRLEMQEEATEPPLDYFRELAADQFAVRNLFREVVDQAGFEPATARV